MHYQRTLYQSLHDYIQINRPFYRYYNIQNTCHLTMSRENGSCLFKLTCTWSKAIWKDSQCKTIFEPTANSVDHDDFSPGYTLLPFPSPTQLLFCSTIYRQIILFNEPFCSRSWTCWNNLRKVDCNSCSCRIKTFFMRVWLFFTRAFTARIHTVADPEGAQRIPSNPPPCRPFLNIIWKWNNLVSVRPNYFIFMGYLRKWDKISKGTPTLFT